VGSHETERREIALIRTRLDVLYKLFSHDSRFGSDSVYRGTVRKIGRGGVMLEAELLDQRWLLGLLTGRVFMGINFHLPLQTEPVKALGRVIRVEPAEDLSSKVFYGLRFHKISREELNRGAQCVIRCQMA